MKLVIRKFCYKRKLVPFLVCCENIDGYSRANILCMRFCLKGTCLETALNVPLPTFVIWLSEKYNLRMNLIPLKLFASKRVSLL